MGADTLQLELVLMILKNFMNQPTLQSVKILQLKRKLLLFLKVKNQRDIINKDFLMLKERIRLDKNLLLLQKRRANKQCAILRTCKVSFYNSNKQNNYSKISYHKISFIWLPLIK